MLYYFANVQEALNNSFNRLNRQEPKIPIISPKMHLRIHSHTIVKAGATNFRIWEGSKISMVGFGRKPASLRTEDDRVNNIIDWEYSGSQFALGSKSLVSQHFQRNDAYSRWSHPVHQIAISKSR